MRHCLALRTFGVLIVCIVGLSACSLMGSSDSPLPRDGVVLSLEVTQDAITPNGELMQVATGEEVTINISADHEGSFHVHSTPEQEIEFEAGDSTHTLTFTSPGKVEMESHDPPLVVAIFEVR